MIVLQGPRVRRGVRLAGAAAVVLASALPSGCGSGANGGGGAAGSAAGVPVIVATTGIWADVVANIACDGAAEVITLIPPGGDPHAFEPSLADRGRLGDADLVVANGLGLEEGLDDTLQAVEKEGVQVFAVGDHVTTLRIGTDGAVDPDEGADPHIWFDPARVLEAVPVLADALVQAGVERVEVERCAAAYSRELTTIDTAVEAALWVVPEDRRRLVTNHDSLAYFADRYGFEVIGTVIPSPSTLAETNPAEIEELAQLIEDAGVPAVFAEAQHSSADADALASRVGDIEVVTLYSGSLGEKGSGAETYLGLLQTDADLIAGALR